MKELHQQHSEVMSWLYTDLMSVIDEYTDLMKERHKAEEEANKDQEASMHSKMSSMQRQYTSGMPKYTSIPGLSGMSGFPSLSNFKL